MSMIVDKAPRYARIAQDLMAAIDRDAYPVGSLLPTEADLCKQFDVSRVTIRGALQELALRSVITRQPGIGTRVARKTPLERFIHESNSIADVLQFTEGLVFNRIRARLVVATADLAQRWGGAGGERMLRVEGLRVSKPDLPVCHSTHHIPEAFAAAIDVIDGATASIALAIAQRFGLEIDEIDQTIEAVNLDKAQAALLRVKKGEAAIVTWRVYRTRGERLLIATRSLFPKDRYSYSIRNRRERSGASAAWSLPDARQRA